MLSKKRCPYTGVVNFYAVGEPLLAVGSVSEIGGARRYAWRCYIDKETSGVASDMAIAEASLLSVLASRANAAALSAG